MESILGEGKLANELQEFNQSINTLATLKIKHTSTTTPAQHPQKKPFIPQIPLAPIPVAQPQDEPHQAESITITLKSLKPSLLFTLSCPTTATISTLKTLLATSDPTAPSPESQRWILKGKAMGDNKLLKEFPIEKEGTVVNLMIKAAVAPPVVTIDTSTSIPAPAPPHDSEPMEIDVVPSSSSQSHSHSRSLSSSSVVPTLTLSPDPLTTTSLPLNSFTSPSPSSSAPLGSSANFITTISAPQVWEDAYALLERHFGEDAEEAKKVWEQWFASCSGFIGAGDMARIREETGLSRMGGI